MLIHVAIISLQCAAIAAFLLLWYFWARKKIETSYLLEDEDQILFPFRYFSWVIMALILLTSIAQIHFVRTSALLNEDMAAILAQNKVSAQQTKSVDELRTLLEKTKRDMDTNFKSLRAQLTDKGLQAKSLQTIADLNMPPDKGGDKEAFLRTQKYRSDLSSQAFAKEARASSSTSAAEKRSSDGEAEENHYRELSMGLSRQGKVLRDQVRVRQKPSLDAAPVDKLMSGQQVKVTEKKLDLEGKIWFRVITPTGRAGMP